LNYWFKWIHDFIKKSIFHWIYQFIVFKIFQNYFPLYQMAFNVKKITQLSILVNIMSLQSYDMDYDARFLAFQRSNMLWQLKIYSWNSYNVIISHVILFFWILFTRYSFVHYSKMCPYTLSDFTGFWMNSLVVGTRTSEKIMSSLV